MPDTGAPWSLPSPSLPDQPHAPAQLGDLADSVHAALGRAYPCTSASRPDPVAGMLIFETDTQILSICRDGTNWAPIWYPMNWTVPASPYLNGWVHYGAGFPALGYWKDPWGIVHLRGLIKSGTVGAAIFTLPTDHRPSTQNIFSCIANLGGCRLDVMTSGNIQVTAYFASGTNGYVSLDGINFPVATSL